MLSFFAAQSQDAEIDSGCLRRLVWYLKFGRGALGLWYPVLVSYIVFFSVATQTVILGQNDLAWLMFSVSFFSWSLLPIHLQPENSMLHQRRFYPAFPK